MMPATTPSTPLAGVAVTEVSAPEPFSVSAATEISTATPLRRPSTTVDSCSEDS